MDKLCRYCNKIFSVPDKKGFNRKVYCSDECQETRRKEWYKKHSKRRTVEVYGISIEAYNNLMETQQNACAICLVPTDKLYVDHCHETKNVRGLLCMKCNAALGLFKDKIENLQNAVAYLTRDSSTQIKRTRGA